MLLTTLATASRKKNLEETENNYKIPHKTKVSNTLNNMSKIISMSGTAIRGSIKKHELKSVLQTFEEKEDEYKFEFIQKTSFEQLIKLQVPSCKSRYKKLKRDEKIMSKSCESIFECLKSYEYGTQKLDSSQSGTSILKTDVSFERKTKRKIEFKICEENPIPLFLDSQESLPKFEFSKIIKNEDQVDFPVLSECPEFKNLNMNKDDVNFGGPQKTISSEDFLENVVSGSKPLTLSVRFPEELNKLVGE